MKTVQKPGTDSPIPTVNACAMGNGHPQGYPGVGGVLSDDEREIHIEDSQHLYLVAYERFQMYGLPTDRDEALQHLHRMNEAIRGRSAAVLAQRHAAFEQRLAEGIDYFAAAGQRDRYALERRAA